jgi:hypothetical protein
MTERYVASSNAHKVDTESFAAEADAESFGASLRVKVSVACGSQHSAV